MNHDGYAVITATGGRTHKKMLLALQAHFGCSGSEVVRELIERGYAEHVGGDLIAPTRRFQHTDGRVYPRDSAGAHGVTGGGDGR